MTRPERKSTLETIRDRRGDTDALFRDLTDGTESRRSGGEGKAYTSQLAWLFGILASVAAIFGAVLLVLAVPPVLDCRNRAEQGFFVGQTYGGCVAGGFSVRWNLLEQRVKMALRGSGR
ncbi:hypothetical protein [Methylobacterium sp. 10]|uniref:hypothetical protein n=1 Tax=Methylobacterium sp. 10 TaxID=1101191 RepID=UPI00048881A3|nr:hypothetical protein [Methylobacterium sp. 10]